jgi:hypothetical protein
MAEDDELTPEQELAMAAKLLGVTRSTGPVAEIRRSRRIKRPDRPKPRIEIEARRSDIDREWWDFDFYLCSHMGRHLVQKNVPLDQARREVEKYRNDGTEVRQIATKVKAVRGER